MDEHAGKDVSVSKVLESSTVTASEKVGNDDSEKTTVVIEAVSTEVQVQVHDQGGKGQIEGSIEEVAAEEGGSCNGADIMVGVMGSDVNVDGVCINDSGDGGAGNMSEKGAHGGSGGSVKVGLERDLKIYGGGDSVAGDLGSEGIRESGDETLKLGTENELVGSSRITESTEEGELVEGGDDMTFQEAGVVDVAAPKVEIAGSSLVERGGDDKTLQEGGVVDVATPKVEIGGSSLVDGSTCWEAQLAVKEMVLVTREESLEGGGLVKDSVEEGESNVTGDVNFQEVGASENEVQDQRVENGVESNSVALGCSVGETQVVEENSELVEESIEQPKETDGNGGDALPDSETQKIDVLHNEVLNPGTESAASTILDDSSVETKVVEEAMGKNKSLDSKVKGPGSDALEGVPSGDPMEGTISSSERLSVSTEKDGNDNTTSKSLDEQTQVAVEGVVASIDNEDVTCPDIEGMDTDAFNENFCFSVEELQATVETANGRTENGYNTFADSQSLHRQSQVIVGAEVAATENNMILNTGKDQKLVIGVCLEKSMARDIAEVHSNVEPGIGVDKLGTDSEEAGLQNDQNVEIAEQQKVETVDGSTGNHTNVCLDSTTSCQSTQAVAGDEVVDMDYKVLSDTNSEFSDYVHFDGVLASSGNDPFPRTETSCGEMEMDAQAVLTNNEKVLTSNVAQVEGSSEKDQQLELEECLDKSCDPAHIDPNAGQPVEGQEQVTPVAQLEGDNKKVGELNSENETVSVIIETDSSVTCGEETVIGSTEGALNLKTEFKGPAEGDQRLQVEEGLDNSAACDISVIDSNIGHEMTVGEEVDTEQVGLLERQEMEVEEQDADAQQAKIIEEDSVKCSALKPGSLVKAHHQARYQLPPDDEVEFSVCDLVWGKVRSHPWWPGQIFDPSDASEKAMKYHKKDCFLVAYFGDRTFAWNEASLLKPFRSHYSQVEKQSNSETFQNAVDCALEEVSRRVELGLACSCIPKDVYDELKYQVVENTGIRQESSQRDGVDKSTSADLFEPDKLMEYMKALAQSPISGADRLELVIAKSQLLAFYRLRGYSQLPEFLFCGGLLDNSDALNFEDEMIEHTSLAYEDDRQNSSGQEISQTQRSSYHKRKHNLKDSIYPRKKERSLSELMGESWDCVDDEIGPDEKANSKLVSSPSGKKRKESDSFADNSSMPEGRKTISLAKVSTSFPKPSFKIGECIRRVASQMTGSPSILKCNSQKLDGSSDIFGGDVSDASFQQSEDAETKRMILPTEYSSLDDLLSQLHLAARDPLKGYSFFNIIIGFFSDFRNSVIMEQHDKVGGKRRKTSQSFGGSPETFEFDDMSDTYWTDRVIQNGSEEQPSRKSRKRDTLFVPVELGKPLNRSNSRKRYSDGNYDASLEKPLGYVDEKAPAELVMHFPVVDSVPSEMNLNKMFKHFGPLKESETEVDTDTNRARVVFKRCSDAEAAYGSAPKFNIFGPMLVNYQLNYTISVPFKTLPIATTQGEDDATLFLEY